MHVLECGDMIGYDSPEEGYIYGIIDDINGDEIEAEYLDDEWETFIVPVKDADYIEPVYIDDETAAAFARYEIGFKELTVDVYPPERVRTGEKHVLTIDELLSALEKTAEVSADEFGRDWFYPIYYVLSRSFDCGHPAITDEGTDGYRFLPNVEFFVWNAMSVIDNRLFDKKYDFSDVVEELKFMKEQLRLPVEHRQYDDGVKEYYIKSFDKGNMLTKATETELSLFVRYVNELCEKDNKTALYAKAYGCYGGNRAFDCDWTASRDALLKLCALDENPFLYNTLGYIYYYGRCTDGEPEYEKAFKCFSIGAAGGVYESQYKLSDMFRHGCGTAKNDRIASEIIWRLYDENIGYMFDGKLDCKFADVAFRVGNLVKEGVGCEADANRAYYFYLQADFAIRMRMLEDEHYGDAKVAEGIKKAMEEVLHETSFEKRLTRMKYPFLEDILKARHGDDRLLEMKAKRAKDGELLLKFRILPRADEKYQPKLFITEPGSWFCGLMDSISAKTAGFEKLKLGTRLMKEDGVTVVFDKAEYDCLYLYGRKVAEVFCEDYAVSYPRAERERKMRFASVIFQTGGREYDYICGLEDVKAGDSVIVPTQWGEAKVEVVRVFEKYPTQTALPIAKYKSVLRKE